jgi:hypothetical protein
MPNDVEIKVAHLLFKTVLEEQAAPASCNAFVDLLPLRATVIQVRWSGEAGWVPLDNLDLRLGYENRTTHPVPGHALIYAGGVSRTETLLPIRGLQVCEQNRPIGWKITF